MDSHIADEAREMAAQKFGEDFSRNFVIESFDDVVELRDKTRYRFNFSQLIRHQYYFIL